MADCIKTTNCDYKTKRLRAQQAPQLQKGFAACGFPERCLWEMSTDGTSEGGPHGRASRVGFAGERQTRLSLQCRTASLGREPSPSRGWECLGLPRVRLNLSASKSRDWKSSGWGTTFSLLNRCIYSSPSFTLLEWHQQNTQLLQLNAQLISVYIL